MRVTHTGNNPVQNADVSGTTGGRHAGRAGASRRGERAEQSQAASSDGVKSDISTRGREYARAKELAANAPDVREDRIADLKRRIAEGKYQIDADGLADRMVNEHMHMGIG